MGYTVHFEKMGLPSSSLFMATLGLSCCTRLSLVAREWGYPLAEVSRLLTAADFPAAGHKTLEHRFNSGAWA